MKKLFTTSILTAILLTTLQGCSESTSNIESTDPQLVVMVYDISRSTDAFATLTESHIEDLYYGIGQKGDGKFYGLLIQSNSLKQDPVTASVPALEQMEPKGNVYQRANRERKNEQLKVEFEKGKDDFVKPVSAKLILPKNENFSDIKNALEMSRVLLENPAYNNHIKHLLIISDMENDFPPTHGIDPMESVYFGNDINILIVRPSNNIKIEDMIPGVRYSVYVSLDDALNSLFNNSKH